jgi:hypothetical protein
MYVLISIHFIFFERQLHLKKEMFSFFLQGYNECLLKSSFRKFYGRYNDLDCDYKLSLAHILNDLFHTIC